MINRIPVEIRSTRHCLSVFFGRGKERLKICFWIMAKKYCTIMITSVKKKVINHVKCDKGESGRKFSFPFFTNSPHSFPSLESCSSLPSNLETEFFDLHHQVQLHSFLQLVNSVKNIPNPSNA